MRGCPPSLIKQTAYLGDVIPERSSPTETVGHLSAGSIAIWRVVEPDNTYHKKTLYDNLEHHVQAQLDIVVKSLADFVDELSSNVKLRVTIATDHGRLLAKSTREISPPNGMKASGRAAWGDGHTTFPSAGYKEEGEIVILDDVLFGLNEDLAIILSESSFLTADGSGGSELYPHGGLFPEEIIVPWIEYVRDATAPEMSITIRGSGQAGQAGTLLVEIANTGMIPGTVVAIQVGPLIIDVGRRVDSLESKTFEVAVSSWPSSKSISSNLKQAIVQVSSGIRFELPVRVVLNSEEMYAQEDILEGLDL
jgi:hypothetical protein